LRGEHSHQWQREYRFSQCIRSNNPIFAVVVRVSRCLVNCPWLYPLIWRDGIGAVYTGHAQGAGLYPLLVTTCRQLSRTDSPSYPSLFITPRVSESSSAREVFSPDGCSVRKKHWVPQWSSQCSGLTRHLYASVGVEPSWVAVSSSSAFCCSISTSRLHATAKSSASFMMMSKALMFATK
jgi:hypothetical protein